MGSINVDPTDTGSAVSTAGAATVNHSMATVVTEALTTAAGTDYLFTLTNNDANVNSRVFVSISNGTNTTFYAEAHNITPSAGQVAFNVRNTHPTAALNGTLILNILVL